MSRRSEGKGREKIPAERGETLRQAIRSFLEGPPATVRELSRGVGASEKDVLAHMEHLGRSLPRQGSGLVVTPAECEECGFVFRKRGRLRKPGRCPLCRSTRIADPLYGLRRKN